MRTPAQRGRYGRWLVTSREARNFDTADRALAALAAAGVRIGRSTYAEYESGSKVPSRNHLPLLEQFWGPVPTEEAADSPDLASAIRDLTAELRLMRESQPSAGAATAELVAIAIHETLQAAGLVAEPQRP